ncbi:hypothetical protein AVEN_29042-1 [Araneus ventricosus]|uniref:Endonuclease/exonuclease/phosphatase domain-containing protein n=1 Tax=Araneus ventricosus TaxID=182803 RepID=A0A4Y2AM02_ARAVE|nr:hypothetical protein AVEN_29042-1 [Araneus ventricosus]
MACVVSWNGRGFRSKVCHIKDLIYEVHPVCIALQKTYLKPADIAKIKRYSLVREKIMKIICNCLHPILATEADELPTPFIIIGDFNGHSPLWGSKNTNTRGRQIEEFVNTHSLCLLNNGEDTYFHQRNRTFHSLDLVLCTPSLAPYFNFRVEVDLRDSDHFPIFLDRVNVDSNDAQRPTRYLFHRADWTNFTLRALITRDMVEGENLNEVVNLVTKTIISAADASIPKSGLSFPKNRKPWWNKYCTYTNRDQRRSGMFSGGIQSRLMKWLFKELKSSQGGLGGKVNMNTKLNLCPVLIPLLQQKICGIMLEGRAVFIPKNAYPVCERTVRRFVIFQKWWMFLLKLLPLFAQQVTIPNLSSHIKIVRNALLCASRRQNNCLTTLT